MSIWSQISEALAALREGQPLSAVFDRLRTPPERSVAFTIAIIALGAKMAKADGHVSRSEVTAFRDVFTIAADEAANAARVFNLARQDVAGFEAYARRIATMFGEGHPALCDLMDGLFHIALADGAYHDDEDMFLREVSAIFGLGEPAFRHLRARFVEGAEPDPFAVLGVAPDTSMAQIRATWRAQVRDCHPDRLAARGVPKEAVKLAEQRLVAINRAWDDVQTLRGS
jgi:DnaJ like chaperone protein